MVPHGFGIATASCETVGEGSLIKDRVLREIHETHRFESPQDLMRLVPEGLPDRFTTADLARMGGFSRDDARRMAYCLRTLGLFMEHDRTKAGINYLLPAKA